MQVAYLIAALSLIVYATLVWFLGDWLGLAGTDRVVLRVVLWLIGVAIAGIVLFLIKRRKAESAPGAVVPGQGLEADVRFVVREANERLRASYGVRKTGKNAADLPLVLFLGDSGATKTTAILHSGLDPELLSGQTNRDGNTVPTAAANVWLGAGTIFVEAGGPVLNDPPAWKRLVDLLRARTLTNLLGRAAQSPRAIVLCVDCSGFANPQAGASVTSAARRFQAAIGDVAQRWGSRLPVYVLFTKLDQVPYFTDFVRTLSNETAGGGFGTTLPLSTASAGAYNEQESRRLTEAFESLFLALAANRPQHLRAENDASKLPNIYEFPREFRKLRDNVVRFLLDVGRPSQLRASPFLRGFYFAGVRPVSAEGSAPVAPQPAVPAADAGATRIFAGGAAAFAAMAQPSRVPSSRRVPQWVFLRQFFQILLEDRAARGASGTDTRAGLIRRALLGTAAAALLIWITGATVSWFNNRALVERAASASRALASGENLAQLEQLRSVTADVTSWERNGAPMSHRWGVYPGTELYENTRAAYCRAFGKTLLGPVRGAIETRFASLRPVQAPGDDYERTFAELKSYLMMTSHAAKTDPAFLTSSALEIWSRGRRLSSDDEKLARAQFAFYASERQAGMCPASADSDAVDRARAHLWAFQPLERIYRNILTDVSRSGPPLRFSDPSGAVLDLYEVPWAFTKDGWGAVARAIGDVTRHFSRDPWVLGDERPSSVPATAELQGQLRTRYAADYANHWRSFLGAARISGYAGLKDASVKLNGITSSESSLLRLFCTVAQNTAVEAPDIAKEFASVQRLEPAATCREKLNDTPTQAYMTALSTIKFQVDEMDKLPDPSTATIDAMNAKVAARTASQSLNLPAHVEKLMLDPILQAEALVQRKAPEGLNGKGKDFCTETSGVFSRFPFNPGAAQEVRPDELGALLAPNTGRFWKFVGEGLQDVLLQAGSGFAPKSGARFKVSPSFLAFANKMAALSHAMYATNPAKPALVYSVQGRPSPGVENFSLNIRGKTLSGSGAGGAAQDFVWTGDPDTIILTPKVTNGSVNPQSWSGVWAVQRFLAQANRVSENNTVYEYDLTTAFGRQTADRSGPQATLKLRVTGPPGTNLIGSMATSCVSRIAQ